MIGARQKSTNKTGYCPPICVSAISRQLGFPGGSDHKESVCDAGDPSLIPGWGRFLEKETATHSSILAYRIPWTEEPGSVQSRGRRVGHE